VPAITEEKPVIPAPAPPNQQPPAEDNSPQ
jgi:hypothetical protein